MKNFSFKSTFRIYGVSFLLYIEINNRGTKKGNTNVHSMGKEVLGAHEQPQSYDVILEGWTGLYDWSTCNR